METKFLLSVFYCAMQFGLFSSEFVTKEDFDNLRHEVLLHLSLTQDKV